MRGVEYDKKLGIYSMLNEVFRILIKFNPNFYFVINYVLLYYTKYLSTSTLEGAICCNNIITLVIFLYLSINDKKK